MTLPQREHPEARAELRTAVHWYDERNPGVGQNLLDGTFEARCSIGRWPDAAPPLRGGGREPNVRARRVSGFPYLVIYFVADTEIVILAYAHERRRPGYWRHRVDD